MVCWQVFSLFVIRPLPTDPTQVLQSLRAGSVLVGPRAQRASHYAGTFSVIVMDIEDERTEMAGSKRG